MRRQIVSVSLMFCLLYLSLGAGPCSKPNMLFWARESVSFLREAQPLLQSVGIPGDKIATAITWGDKLVVALEKPDTGTGDPKQIAQSLIKAFEEVILQTNIIPDGPKKTLILAILGLANIALRHIANQVTSTTAGRVAAGPEIIKFKNKPEWKCRNAKNGRWEKMEFCKKNPDISVVETR